MWACTPKLRLCLRDPNTTPTILCSKYEQSSSTLRGFTLCACRITSSGSNFRFAREQSVTAAQCQPADPDTATRTSRQQASERQQKLRHVTQLHPRPSAEHIGLHIIVQLVHPREIDHPERYATGAQILSKTSPRAGNLAFPGVSQRMPTDLESAEAAARKAGQLLRDNYSTDLQVDEIAAYDIKLALDVKSQELITGILLEAFPEHAIFGEEGIAGNQDSEFQWIVDPIDGTVNYFYGIPHFCVSIALRECGVIKTGVIYDPMLDELWAVEKGNKPTLNGREIACSPRAEMSEAVVTIGFSKSKESMDAGFKRFSEIAYQVRKTRMMGSAALAMAYICCGRLDAYIEEQISLWDIAAGQLLVEEAGGQVNLIPNPIAPGKESICAFNGKLPLGHIFGE